MEINSNAPVTSRRDISISAPLESVWRVHTEIDSWPQWNPDIAKAELTGPIAVGTAFRWETAGMEIPSTIGEVVLLRKLAWSGETGAILAIHVWTFHGNYGRQAPLKAIVFEIERLRCNGCCQVFTAAEPAGVGTDKYDTTAGAVIALLKYGTGVPSNRASHPG